MRRLPIGAEIQAKGTHFRVWAPKGHSLEVAVEGNTYPLDREKNGFFSGLVEEAREGSLYHFFVGGKGPFPDPASRFQPKGPHGPSQIIDPRAFPWNEGSWKGIVDPERVVLYELHVGTFTQEGTWHAAIEKLPYLKELGINVIQMMPVAEVPGRFNWGYDGVNLFAPTRNYGAPEDLRLFVQEAHRIGIGVILDVVYNHFGPDGNYLSEFSDHYFKKEETEWGSAINFDGEESQWTRQFFIENGGYWVEEFHFDGLRLDACHSIVDASTPHILVEIRKKMEEKSRGRALFITAENEKQESHFVASEEEGGLGLNAVYDEDFHHTAFVQLTKKREAYLGDYAGRAQEFVSSIRHNFLYQGQWYDWQKQGRGSPALGMKASHFIHFLENHDQMANTGQGLRLAMMSHPKAYRAMTTLLLLGPQIPMLFQGQEFCSSSPFYFFCEHLSEPLIQAIYQGRLEFILQFASLEDPDLLAHIPYPNDLSTFLKSKLNWNDLEKNRPLYHLHKDLIALRATDRVFRDLPNIRIEGSAVDDLTCIIRYFGKEEERLILVSFGRDAPLFPASDPLLAPPEGAMWEVLFSSESARYGGSGHHKIPEKGNWKVTGSSALIFHSSKKSGNGKKNN